MADLLSYALVDVASVKESLGIPSANTSKDNLIKRKINQATLNIETFCNLARDHHFKEATYTDELYKGNGSDQLVLKMRPVSSLTSFKRADSTESDSSYDDVESDLYRLNEEAGIIELVFSQGGYWWEYKVTYVAGFSTIPADLAEACVSLASFYVDNGTSGTNVKKKQEGRRSIEYFQGQNSDSIIKDLGLDDTLSRYINYQVGV